MRRSVIEAGVAAGATIDRIEPDPLVSLADIAARTHLSRAAITQYAKGQRSAGFPRARRVRELEATL